MSSTTYADFLASKHVKAKPSGFEPGDLPSVMFPFQADGTRWACRQGKAALWFATGLGKTISQLSWADQVVKHTGGKVLILCPLAVAKQTAREAAKFGIETDVTVCRSPVSVKAGINVTNYQMLKNFDASEFVGVVIDESDILADFTGATKRMIIDKFSGTPYKLDCSATPAPNSYMEIGNHSDFLDALPGTDMLARWFINDTSEAGNYKLKEHGKADFFRWVASWAAAVTKPSDLGYDDGAFDLPPLHIHEHFVHSDIIDGREDGFLFRAPSMSATSMHSEMRRTVADRVSKAEEIIAGIDASEPILLWCHTNNEADEVVRRIAGVTEIRGAHSVDRKEAALEDFAAGNIRILCGKPSMFGHGLNWQHCRNVIFVGLDYSFKMFYQAIRRCWRFGQTRPVNVHVILADTESRLIETLQRKQGDYDEMTRQMVAIINRYGLGAERRKHDLVDYNPTVPMVLPPWLQESLANSPKCLRAVSM